ncbi:hypothetical protein LSUB1_G002391 [Lachnellula subtilissima]|uniref:DNA damage-responsive protein 48 n=1 Tax=Lachnellula subtilissima TaxID=602034 RepID=A0A8H8RT74_9HELO|nr:hypothetical protein LSUB1_G002391 [Lachnellula subtilissima]
MDFVSKFTGGNNSNDQNQQGEGQGQGQANAQTQSQDRKTDGGMFSGISNKLNSAAGGGKESEKNEDALDKAIDLFQEKVIGQGPQDNESAVEQAKDEQMSDFIRGKYKGATGKEFPVEDKETRFG